MKIFIKTLEQETIELDVEPYYIIKQIKLLIKKRKKIDIEKQRLIFKGIPLNNERTLADYDIKHQSNIYFLIKDEDELLSIYINILGRKKFLINIIASEKINKLKKDIQEKENIPIQEQNLFFCDQELRDSYSLNHYNIESDDIILCIIFDNYINVKLRNKLYKIRYNESYTISELKNEINKNIFIKTAFQLKYNNNILEDNKTLKFYGLSNNSTIELIQLQDTLLRLRNGCCEPNKEITNYLSYSKMNRTLIDKIVELEENLKILMDNKNNFRAELFPVIISSKDQKIHRSFICKKDESFKVLENLLYETYPQYKNTENIFTVNKKVIDTNKSIEENDIKDNDNIIIQIKEK